MAISLNQMYHPGHSANSLRSKPSVTIKSALVFSVFMLFSAAAQATVCFLPDGNCGGVNYGYTDERGSTCTYKTREEAVRKKGDCETVQKLGFCFYLNCSMSKSDCDKEAANAPNHDKCCVPCGNCWKVADCSIPPIETCTGAGYETEQTCKNNNQNFKPNGKFDKNGTACGECKDVPYITCPEMGDDYVTRAECTAKGSSFTFTSANVKDSDGNECGTCDEEDACRETHETEYNILAYNSAISKQKHIMNFIGNARGIKVQSSSDTNAHIEFINHFVDCKINKSNITGTYQGLSFATIIYDGNIRQTYNNYSSQYINSCKHMTGTYGCSGIAPWYKNNNWWDTYSDKCLNRKIIIIGLVPGSKIKRVSVTPFYMSKPCTSINQDTGEIEPYCRMYKCYSDDGYYGTVDSSNADEYNTYCYHGCDSLRHFNVSLAELKSTYFLDNYEDDLSIESYALRSHIAGSYYQDEFDRKLADKGPFKLTKCWYPSGLDNIDNITFDAVEFTVPLVNRDTDVKVVFEKDDEISCKFSTMPDLYIDRFGKRYNDCDGFPFDDMDEGFSYDNVFSQVDKCTSYPYYDTDYIVDFDKDCK